MPNLPTKVKFTNRSSAFSNKAFLEVKPKRKRNPLLCLIYIVLVCDLKNHTDHVADFQQHC